MVRNKRAIPRQATSAVAVEGHPPAPDDPLLSFAPYLHAAPRGNSITPDLQRRFIAQLAATGIVTQAARRIGKSMEALYKLRHRPGAEGFAAAWDAAVERGVSRLEDGALARAIAGEERMVVSSGKLIGTEHRHNEALVMFFLRHRRRERYGAERDRPADAVYAEARSQAMAAARELIAEHKRQELGELMALVEHMVANRLAGRAAVAGLDTAKPLHENARMLREAAAARDAGGAGSASSAGGAAIPAPE